MAFTRLAGVLGGIALVLGALAAGRGAAAVMAQATVPATVPTTVPTTTTSTTTQTTTTDAAPSAEAPTAADAVAAVDPEAVAAIARELNCPLCQGYSLLDCPLQVCGQMRQLIADRLAEGWSADQVRAQFVADYGPQILSAPPARGWGLLAWLAPLVAALSGAAVLWLRRKAGATAASATVESGDGTRIQTGDGIGSGAAIKTDADADSVADSDAEAGAEAERRRRLEALARDDA